MVDTDLYSRQIGTFGMQAMGKLIQMKVLISGLRGVGIQTAKNLILAGPNTVTVHDDTIASISDLGSNFYLTEADVGSQTRAQASVAKLQELNPYVKVNLKQGPLQQSFISEFNVVLLTESNFQTITRINAFCRSQTPPIGFINCESWGAAGYGFVDFGPEFVCFDKDGEETKSFIINGISQDNPGVVTVHDEKRHTYQDGDYVVFREVQGMEELNNTPPRPIKFVGPFAFSIEDTTGYSPYLREGIVEQVKVPETLNFKSWTDSLLTPVPEGQMLPVPDFGKFGRSEQLHIAFQAVHSFQQQTGHLPQFFSDQDAGRCVELANEINQRAKDQSGLSVEEVEAEVVQKVSKYARAQTSPTASFWGGIIAQQIIKYTGKYTPMKQWLHVDFFQILPGDVERSLQNSRYDDQIALVGNEIHNKITNANTFLVGAGALGCEYLKLFALMGLACEGGKVVVTDDDQIEVSNLNRQFLFRMNDVKHSKSERASLAARNMNSALNVEAKQDRVSQENETIFTDAFWGTLDFVTNAVDNVNARLYVDSRCVWYEKPLFESGTLGTKANSQVILPHKTQSYGDSQDPPEESIPMCTLKNFPHAIEHCIEWARDEFHGTFTEGPQECNKYLQNPIKYLAGLPSQGNETIQKDKLTKIKEFLALLREPTFEKCVGIARNYLQDLFFNNISQLLHNFPVDYKTKDGTPFWSGPKRAPTPCIFDQNDETHIGFVLAASNLIAYNIGLEPVRDIEQIKGIVRNVQVPEFVPRTVNIQVEENQTVQATQDQAALLSALLDQMKIVEESMKEKKAFPADFEKDDDSNFHIDFIHAAANLRAENYKIPIADRQKAKMIAGKIIPAIATTTAMIAGAIALQIYTFYLHDDVEKFRNGFVSLALPLLVFSEPMPPLQTKSKDYDPILMGPVKAYPENFSTWDKLVVAGPCTLQEFIDKLKTEHQLKVNIVSCGKTCVYNGYLPGNKHADRLPKVLHTLYEEISGVKIIEGRRYLAVEASCEGLEEDIDMAIPVVKYTFQQLKAQ